jgi:16S rRNA (cytidine1402-2'-O)-methyltransferase
MLEIISNPKERNDKRMAKPSSTTKTKTIRDGANPNANLPAGLYLVATPIGNLGDITLRALETLKKADLILCEDTRVSGKLLAAYDIKNKLLSLHDHNEENRSTLIIDKIKEGLAVALISDAGMPLISDPGYKLVTACIENEIYVTSIPGASSVLMALQLSGLPSDKFLFLGFLPTKTKARTDLLSSWKQCPATLIVFENGLRVKDTCHDIQKIFGERHIVIARELTKLFEDTWRGTPAEIIDRINKNGAPKGEVVIVIDGAKPSENHDKIDIDQMILDLLNTYSVKDTVAMIVDQTNLSKKEIYARTLTLSQK